MSIPKEPRQLMINLMYLVLTAMLAINVSSEILNAFKIINKSIQRSNENMNSKNGATINGFSEALKDPRITADPEKVAKVKEALGRAQQLEIVSNEMAQKILSYRNEVIREAKGYEPILDKVTGDSVLANDANLDAATAVMIERDKRGIQMKSELDSFKSKLIALAVKPGDTSYQMMMLPKVLDTLLPITFDYGTASQKGTPEDWAYHNFHMVPTIGAKTILDKYVNDVKNSQSIVLDQLWSQAFGEKRKKPEDHTKDQIVFTNKFSIINSPENSYLLPGQKYTSKIMVGSYNTSNSQAVYIAVNGSPVKVVDGVASYETVAPSTPGEKVLKITGTIYDPNIKQNVAATPMDTKYFVGTPAASISLDKMNVFYLGVDNPITVSASGIPLENLQVTSSGNITLVKSAGAGEYAVRVSGAAGTKGTITLAGKRSDGQVQNFGTREYRIKKIPNPTMKYMNKYGGKLRVDLAKIGLQLEAELKDFDFDAKFEVLSYTLTCILKDGETNYNIKGPFINSNPQADAARKLLKNKDVLYFENIRVMGPDKVPRSMEQLVFTMIN